MTATEEIGDLLETAIGPAALSNDDVEAYVASDAAIVLAWIAGCAGSPDLRRVDGAGTGGDARAGASGVDDAVANGPIVGVAIAREFGEPGALAEHPYLHADPAELLSRIDLTEAQFPVGSVLVTGIAEAYRGRGLGREISFAAVDALAERDATPILQLEWDRPDSPGVDQLEKAGFAPRARLENHFPPEWTCGACETSRSGGRCSCDVVAFLL